MRSPKRGRHTYAATVRSPGRTDPRPRPGTPNPPNAFVPARRHKRPGRLIQIAALTVALLVVGGFLALRPDDPRGSGGTPASGLASTPTGASSQPVQDATSAAQTGRTELEAWVRTNLSRDAVVVTDPGTAADLRGAGFTRAVSYADAVTMAVQMLDYEVSMPGAVTSDAAVRLRARALPLAVFGQGTGSATVRQIFTSPPSQFPQLQATDAALRRAGGEQLVDNPAIVLDSAARVTVQGGHLDLRAQSVANVLATSGPIWLSVPSADPAEQRAGLPSRSIIVTAKDAPAMQANLAALTPPYRPDAIVSIAASKVRLTWTPQIAPVVPAGG